MRWLKYDVSNRKQFMVEVLGCVRFPLVSKTFLSKTVQAEPLIQDNPQCLKMVIGGASRTCDPYGCRPPRGEVTCLCACALSQVGCAITCYH